MIWLTGPWNLPIELQIDAASNDARILLHSQENVNSLMRARELICEYDSNIWTLEQSLEVDSQKMDSFWQNNKYVRWKCMEEYFITFSLHLQRWNVIMISIVRIPVYNNSPGETDRYKS